MFIVKFMECNSLWPSSLDICVYVPNFLRNSCTHRETTWSKTYTILTVDLDTVNI